jgi:hypothetical protein
MTFLNIGMRLIGISGTEKNSASQRKHEAHRTANTKPTADDGLERS